MLFNDCRSSDLAPIHGHDEHLTIVALVELFKNFAKAFAKEPIANVRTHLPWECAATACVVDAGALVRLRRYTVHVLLQNLYGTLIWVVLHIPQDRFYMNECVPRA